MSLLVWMPLNGNLNNQGLGHQTASISTTPIWASSGKIGSQSFYTKTRMTTMVFPELAGVSTYSVAYWIYIPTDTTFTAYSDMFGIEFNCGGGLYWDRDERRAANTTGLHRYHFAKQPAEGINENSYYGTVDDDTANDAWVHVVVTKDNNNAKLYIDNDLKITIPSSNFENSPRTMTGRMILGDSGCEAYLQDLRIYDHVLSPLEIKKLSQGLVLHYTLSPVAENQMFPSLVEEKTPYVSRPSGGSISVGNREFDTVVGGTVAWNQHIQNGNFTNTSTWGVTRGTLSASSNQMTVTSNGTGYTAVYTDLIGNVVNHAMLIKFGIKVSNNARKISSSVSNMSINTNKFLNNKTLSSADTWYDYGTVYKPTDSSALQFRIGVDAMASGETYTLRNINVIDLTQMFGSTIADYIYGLETANAGDGVSYFRSLFPKNFYAFNAGTLMSVNVASHMMTGKNLLSSSFSTGQTNTGVTFTRQNDMTVIANGTATGGNAQYAVTFTGGIDVPEGRYLFSGCPYNASGATMNIYVWDNTNHVRAKQWDRSTAVVTDIGADSGKQIYIEYGISYSLTLRVMENKTVSNAVFKPMLFLPDADPTYAQYESHTYALDSDLTLRGVPKLDESSQMYYDGDTYESDGTVTRRYGIVDLGTLAWAATGTNISDVYRMRSTNIFSETPAVDINKLAKIVCAKYTTIPSAETSNGVTGISVDQGGYLRVYDPNYNTSTSHTSFKTAMDGVYLVYELVTPTTESADPYENPQIVIADGTEQYVDYAEAQGTRDVGIPVGHVSKYFVGEIPDNYSFTYDQYINMLGVNDGIEYDVSGYRYNSTDTLDLSYSSDTPRYGSATVFGSSSKLPIPQIFALNQTVNEITCGIWFKTNTMNSTAPNLFSLYQNCFLRMRIRTDGTFFEVFPRMRSGTTLEGRAFYPENSVLDNQWHHVVYIFNHGVHSVYFDGAFVSSYDDTSKGEYLEVTALQVCYIGAYSSTAEKFVGSLSDFRIYATALSASDILALYQTPISLTSSGVLFANEYSEV